MGAWWQLAMTSLGVTLAVFLLRGYGLLSGMENRWLDLMADIDRPEFAAPVVVVAITDEDYFDPSLFGGVSPLDPGALARILERVLEHRPRGVILDIQVHPAVHESPSRAQHRMHLYRLLESAGALGHAPIILVRDFAAERVERSVDAAVRERWESLTRSQGLVWADPRLGYPNGRVRELPLRHEGQGMPGISLPTVLGAAVEQFRLAPEGPSPWWTEEGEPSALWRIRFTGHFLEEHTLLSPHHISAGKLLAGPTVGGQQSMLTDRIVLIGGAYHAGRDLQATPVGDMAGVYVWAEAIASRIRDDALREPTAALALILEFLIGALAGILLLHFGPAYGLLLGLLVVGPMAILCSLLTFGSGVLFVNFLPSVLGVYLHYQIEIHREIRRLKRQLARS